MDKGEIIPIIIVIVILIAGSGYYYSSGLYVTPASFWEGARFKVGYLDENMKLFVSVPAESIGRLRAAEGASSPSDDAMVLGAAEATMMREESLFSSIGDPLSGFFGIDTRIGGILRPGKDVRNDAHFLSPAEFAAIAGEEGLIKVLFTPDGMPKFFFRYEGTEERPRLVFAEGSLDAYKPVEKEGKAYAPIILGADEAVMMREEKLIAGVGSTLDGFFGTDVVVVGILEKTGTAVDMLHFVQQETWGRAR